MHFQGYGKIGNPHNSRAMTALRDLAATDKTILWLATEKVDGANFSLRVDTSTGEVTCGRRRGILKPGEAFYGWEALVYGRKDGEVEGALEGSAQAVAAHYYDSGRYGDGLLEVVVFGEICGGQYPGYKSQTKAVQNRVHYSDERAFIAFDVMLRYANRCVFVDPWLAREVMRDAGFIVAPAFASMYDAEHMLKLSPLFDTLVPYHFALHWIPGNAAEGFVVVPCMDQVIYPGVSEDRVAIKVKAPGFMEGGNAKRKRKVAVLTDDESALEVAALGLVCESRFRAVRSKELEDCRPMRLSGLLVSDAWADLESGLDAELLEALTKAQIKAVTRRVRKESNKRVADWLAAA